MSNIQLAEISSYSDLADQEIWNAFRNGDKEALEVIYNKNINTLFLYGLKIKGDESLIKDCIQELFVELWNSKSNLSPTTNINFYLLRALRYKINHQLSKVLKNKLNQKNLIFNNDIENSYEKKLIDDFTLEEKEKKIQKLLDQFSNRRLCPCLFHSSR